MRNFLKLYSFGFLCTVTLALFPPSLHAQRWVYVNDNNPAANANTVTGFSNIPAATLARTNAGEPPAGWPTGGTGLSAFFALQNQALYTLGTPAGTACLFMSDPAPGAGYPNGDIAVFHVNTATGALRLTGRYASPNGNSGNLYGIALATGKGTLYAGWTLTNMIEVWYIAWNGKECTLSYSAQTPAAGLTGGHVDGMRESPNFSTLVVAYADGSIQSFSTLGGTIAATCAVAINSTGFTDGNAGTPAGVDITKDSKYAIFGDASAVTELEVVKLPITCVRVTKDFGGPGAKSATNLGPGVSSNNVWLSPNGLFIYVANNASGQVTTVDYNEGLVTMALAAGCTFGHTNPTLLKLFTLPWWFDAGIETSVTTGTGTRLYVAEYGNGIALGTSSVALLKVDAVGCTEEEPLSPFNDPNSGWALSLNAWPPRLF
jgi:hypothetical protein